MCIYTDMCVCVCVHVSLSLFLCLCSSFSLVTRNPFLTTSLSSVNKGYGHRCRLGPGRSTVPTSLIRRQNFFVTFYVLHINPVTNLSPVSLVHLRGLHVGGKVPGTRHHVRSVKIELVTRSVKRSSLTFTMGL